MRTLEVRQMEVLNGGQEQSALSPQDTIDAVSAGCAVAAVASVAAGFFTLGAGTVFGLSVVGAACAGWGLGTYLDDAIRP